MKPSSVLIKMYAFDNENGFWLITLITLSSVMIHNIKLTKICLFKASWFPYLNFIPKNNSSSFHQLDFVQTS